MRQDDDALRTVGRALLRQEDGKALWAGERGELPRKASFSRPFYGRIARDILA